MRFLAHIMLCSAMLAATLTQPALARDLPDLVIVGSDLRHSGDCSGRDPLIVGDVKIQNVGQGRGQIFTTKVMLQARAKSNHKLSGNDRFVNSMRPGEVVTVEARIKANGASAINGPVSLELIVDPVKVFQEENEQNNRATVTVKVQCSR